jgi:hypothetical protein
LELLFFAAKGERRLPGAEMPDQFGECVFDMERPEPVPTEVRRLRERDPDPAVCQRFAVGTRWGNERHVGNFGPYYKVAANKSQRPGRPFSSCDPRSENFRPAPATRSVTTLDTKTSLDCDCAITRAAA